MYIHQPWILWVPLLQQSSHQADSSAADLFFYPRAALLFEARPGPMALWPGKFVSGSMGTVCLQVTPWKFISSPLKIYHPKRKGSSSNHHFSGAMLNFWGVNQRKQRKFGDWRIIPLSKWLISMVSKSPKWLNSWGEPNLLLTGTILQLRGPLKVTFSKKKVGGGHPWQTANCISVCQWNGWLCCVFVLNLKNVHHPQRPIVPTILCAAVFLCVCVCLAFLRTLFSQLSSHDTY